MEIRRCKDRILKLISKDKLVGTLVWNLNVLCIFVKIKILKMKNQVQKIHIIEAERYLDNARQILTEKGQKDGKFYSDKKYVRMAGNTAWNGVLEALDYTLLIRDKLKKGQRPDVKDYQSAIGKINQSKLKLFNNAYDTLHKVLGYDGNLSVVIVQEGLSEAKDMIDWCSSISN